MKKTIFLYVSIVLAPFFVAFASSEQGSSNEGIEIEVRKASTKLVCCKVELAVSDFVLFPQGATGRYEIKVPAAPWKNEKGSIYFDIEMPIDELTKQGGVIEGFCIRDSDEGASHTVICHIEPQQCDPVTGEFLLKVKTKKREITFDSTYTMIGEQANG